MGFQLPKDSREYFKQVIKRADGGARFDTLFDQYYFCLMIGLDRKVLSPEDELEPDRFIERYPGDYQPQADIVAGLLINAELERKGIEKDDRTSIEQEMLRVLDHQSPSRLSDEGMRLLNLYAAYGFKVIREEISSPPQTLEEFLVFYERLWSQNEQGAIA
jgi:hypothetical protein